MIRVVKKSSGEYIIGCGAIESVVAPIEPKRISKESKKLLRQTVCGLIRGPHPRWR